MRYSLQAIFIATLMVAFAVVCTELVRRDFHLTRHDYAIAQVNGRDGWARAEEGYVVADLNGGTCPIGDKSLQELEGCQRLRKLTAYRTNVTDGGLVYLLPHLELEILHLDDCSEITDGAIPHLSKLTHLRELSVTGTGFTESGLQLLREALPNCKVNPRSHGLAKQ